MTEGQRICTKYGCNDIHVAAEIDDAIMMARDEWRKLPIRICKNLADGKFYLQVGDMDAFLRREMTQTELEQLSKDAEWWSK